MSEDDGIYIYKSYRNISENINEIIACYIAEILNCNTAHYEYAKQWKLDCTKSKILSTNTESWVPAFDMYKYSNSLGYETPYKYAESVFTTEYINMCILDALILNDDRHLYNWSFRVDANTNKVLGMASVYDYNKAFKADEKTKSNTFEHYGNMLDAARIAYQKYGTTLKLDYLYNILDSIDIPINKQAMKNRILYIMGKKETQRDCY